MRKVLTVFLTAALLMLCACSKDDPLKEGCLKYMGDYSYNSSVSAMVYEQVEGEEEGEFGIQYREVTDFQGLTTQKDQAVVLYFYTSSSYYGSEITAGIEDLAQAKWGKLIFVAVDTMGAEEIAAAYEVVAVPEFILLDKNVRISTYGDSGADTVSAYDVAEWLAANGF